MKRIRLLLLLLVLMALAQVNYAIPPTENPDPDPGTGGPCRIEDCYAVTVDYEGLGPHICCKYICPSGTTWVCKPGT